MARKRKGADMSSAPKLPDTVTVRMLYGPRAGQVVQVSRTEAVGLCGGWTPRAELAPTRPANDRETR